MKKANIAELKNHLSRYLDHVRSGESVPVLDRDHPAARRLLGKPMSRLSLIVDGDTTIETFRAAVSRSFALLHEVDKSVCGGRSVRWRLESFHHGRPPIVTCVAGQDRSGSA